MIFGSTGEDCSCDEDMWTARLCKCLQHIGIKHKYIYILGGEEAVKLLKTIWSQYVMFCISLCCPDIETQNGSGIVNSL